MLDLIFQTSGGKFYWTFPRDHCLSMDIFVGADALFSFILTIPLVCLLVLVSEAPVRVLGHRGEFQGLCILTPHQSHRSWNSFLEPLQDLEPVVFQLAANAGNQTVIIPN